MEQFNQNGSNDIDNYESNEQNHTNPNNDNGLHDQGESVAVNNSVNNSANNSNGNDRYQQNQPSQNQPSQNQQYQRNQYPQYQHAQNQNWYGQYPNQYPNQYKNSQYQNSQYYNNQEYVNNQYNQNANNFSAQYPDNYAVNSNGTGSYSSDYVKQSAPYNAMNADSSNVVHDNTQKKKQLQKWQESLNAFIMLGIVCVVVIVVFTMFKGPREFVGGVVNRVSWFFQGRDENGIPKKGYYSTWSRKDLEGNGLRAYNPNTDKDKFDKNGFERELNMPENYVSNSRIVVETSAEKGQLGQILKNGVVDSDVDEAAMKAAYVSYCKAGQEYGSPEVSRSFNEHEGATKRQKTFLADAASRFDGQYDALCDVEQKTPIEPDLLLVKYFQNVSQSDGSSLYVDKNGNPVTLNESAHRDSLISVARYMLYKQGFSKVQVTPGGVIGTSMTLSNKDDNGNYWTGAITEIVVPSKTDPNKFDVYADYIYLPYYFRFYGRLLSFNEDDGNKMIGGELPIEHTNMLRDKNKHLMPFRIVSHNVERPLSDEHKMTGPDYKSELDHIADKFKG